MDKPTKVIMSKSRAEVTSDLLLTGAVSLLMLFAIRPDLLDELAERLEKRWLAIRHQISVWQARESIRSLPETHDRT